MPGWADGPTKRRLRSSWDNYELNDQIPNTEKKGKERDMNSETKWNSAGNTPREKTHTKHLLKYTYHEKPKGLHDYLHMYGFQTHRIQIYAKLRIAHIMLFYANYRVIETTRYNNNMENNAVCRGNQHCEK